MCHLTRLCSLPLLIHLACVFSKICFHPGDIRRAFISREHEKSHFSKHSNASRHFGTVITFPLTFCCWCAMWLTKRKVDNKLIIAFKTVQQRWGAQSAHRQLFSSHLLNKTSGWAHANGWQRLLCFAQTKPYSVCVFTLFFLCPGVLALMHFTPASVLTSYLWPVEWDPRNRSAENPSSHSLFAWNSGGANKQGLNNTIYTTYQLH